MSQTGHDNFLFFFQSQHHLKNFEASKQDFFLPWMYVKMAKKLKSSTTAVPDIMCV